MKREFDYFIALCKENTKDTMDMCYKLYFINNSNKEINALKVALDAKEKECQQFNSSDYLKEFLEVKPKSSIELKYLDEMDLGIDIYINALIFQGKGCYKRRVNLNQVICDGAIECEKVPVINKTGHILSFS